MTAALETIIEAVSSGDKVTLVGFGSLNRGSANREGRNPKTGDKWTFRQRGFQPSLQESSLGKVTPETTSFFERNQF